MRKQNSKPSPKPRPSPKAELAQARKKIEALEWQAKVTAALERVRARAMAMRRSEELAETASVMFREFRALTNIAMGTGSGCWISIIDTEKGEAENWSTDFEGVTLPVRFRLPQTEHAVLAQTYEAWRRGEPLIVTDLSREAFIDFTQYISRLPDFASDPVIREAIKNPPERYLQYEASFSQGVVGIGAVHPLEEKYTEVLQRFAKVFEQTYTRFLDLRKAEEHAREAQVEAALERVRTKAMAMYKSADLNMAVATVFEEMEKLNLGTSRCGIGILDKEKRNAELWTTSKSAYGSAVHVSGDESMDIHPLLQGAFDAWTKQGDFSYVLQGEDLANYYKALGGTNFRLPESQAMVEHAERLQQYYYVATFQAGALFAFRETAFPEEAKAVMRRFAGVFNLTYKRFLDLQKAEARAREAQIEAALERVRAEIASMRTTEDLQRITPLIWRELTTLGVPFFRCGVFIIEEATDPAAAGAHVYLSTSSGQTVAALQLKFSSAAVVGAAVQNWRQQKVYREEWSREQFVAWMQSILQQGLIGSPEEYLAGGEAPEQLVLQFVPFTQGMLYIGSSARLSDDDIELSQAIARAFGIAYARYEDFQKLEAAKAEIEAALQDLRKTQSQLVQAEKMASLGQLTAGIAHEIKNPLNFVNNFARLSTELTDEFVEQLHANADKTVAEVRGALEELLADLRTNNAKINEHGKRADSIVRAMMQHARGGKGERQPTEVNALVEEYLNLTYHGQRAKVPDFNVTLKRDFGEIERKVEMVPQEIGRVLLNLIGNAFDAVREQAQSAGGSYAPEVTVSTRSAHDRVEIRVSDNGCGIPDHLQEKIFEPFFTTKPAGSGTGLGLSLAYDIITQRHGGTLTVESKKSEGATFIITLPTN